MELNESIQRADRASFFGREYPAGAVLFREGEPADSLYLLAQGQVHVVRDSPDGATRNKFATLEAPAYFGEMGLLLGSPRGATVVASGDVMCYQLERRGFDAIIKASLMPYRSRIAWPNRSRNAPNTCGASGADPDTNRRTPSPIRRAA